MALSNRQKSFMEELIANPMLPYYTVGKMCEIPVSTLQRWKKDEEFLKEYNDKLKEVWEDGERCAIDTMLSLCREGNYKAAEFILKNHGYNPATKVDANISGETTINITITEDDE